MRYVVTDRESIQEWLYPGTWDDLSTPPEHEMVVTLDLDLDRLWEIVEPKGTPPPAFVFQQYEQAGIPHSAPDDVQRVQSGLLEAVVAIPAHERWRVAKQWAGTPNAETLASTKKFFNRFCELATIAIANHKFIVLLPDLP